MRKWWFFQEDQLLVCGDRSVALTRRASEVLSVLIKHKGEIVSHDHLLATVWSGLHVTPDLVREYVFDLRRALDDDAAAPHYIETVRAKGVRLIGEVRLAEGSLQDRITVPSDNDMRAVIAIFAPRLPPDRPQLADFATILVESVTADLAQHHDIGVVASRSILGPESGANARDLGQKLGVGYILESSLALLDGRVRATFHLIDTESGRHVWAEKFDHTLEDAWQLADRISKSVVNTLGGWKGELHRAIYKTILQKEHGSLNAFEHFIRACDLEMQLDAAGISRSLRHLEASLQTDSGFARAWVVKSLMLQWAFDVLPDAETDLLVRSEQALERAMELDPADPITRSLHALKCARRGDLVGAGHAIDVALARCWSEADACMTTATACAVIIDDYPTADDLLATAFKLNPAPPSWYRFVEARVSFFLGDDNRAVAASLAAPLHVTAFAYRALAQANLGQSSAALETRKALMTRFPRFSFLDFADYFPIVGRKSRSRFDTALRRLEAATPDSL